MTTSRAVAISFVVIALATLAACEQKAPEAPAPKKAEVPDAAKKAAEAPAPAQPAAAPAPEVAPQPNPDRNAYFGETHLHTSWSLDAWVFGNHLTGPGDALKYAQGQTIKHPLGYDIRIETPLDFMGVTDHSEYVGVTKQANTPGSYTSKLPAAQPLIMKDPNNPADVQSVFLAVLKLLGGPPVAELMSEKVASTVWSENVKLADDNNQPRKFTAFCSYEWTSQFDNRNLHRNIFFRDCAKVPPAPFSALDSWHPEDLWSWMDKQRKSGNELLAISHNANLSDGWMYPTDVDSFGRPIDAAWAASRDRNERLVEIKQIKGQSETHPFLSPNDEFANYEIIAVLLGLPEASGRVDRIAGSYGRQALKDGITMQDTRGYNPYKFGFEGASDSHNSASPYRQNNFYGGHATLDGTIQVRMAGHNFTGADVRWMNPGGLTGAWAEENTRASIWDAMYRKETFGVSGPRIRVRFFGGWDYAADDLKASDWVKKAYAGGVPMGGDLPPMKSKAPRFVVWAVKDPTSANLDRIQIVKGWTKNGQSFEKIFDVAWSGDRKPDKWTGRVPAVRSTVDIDNATYTNDVGSAELKTVWTDPEFDPALHAFYYARVLEIPTPRWTTIQAHQLGIAPPDIVPATVQERAWASPIWYTPSAEARKGASQGLTVAALTKKGGVALNDAQLKALVVGKALILRNAVTNEFFKVSFTAEGQHRIWYVGRNSTMPSNVGDPAQTSSYLGVTSPYRIANGKVMVTLSQEPYSFTIYKLGDTHYAARSNEFGYVNYESIDKPPLFFSPLSKDQMESTKNQADYLHAQTVR